MFFVGDSHKAQNLFVALSGTPMGICVKRECLYGLVIKYSDEINICLNKYANVGSDFPAHTIHTITLPSGTFFSFICFIYLFFMLVFMPFKLLG